MTDKEKELTKLLAKLEENRPEIERIMNRRPLVDTGRKLKPLRRIPMDMDFAIEDGNTEYEVVGYFNTDSDDYVLNSITRKIDDKYRIDV